MKKVRLIQFLLLLSVSVFAVNVATAQKSRGVATQPVMQAFTQYDDFTPVAMLDTLEKLTEDRFTFLVATDMNRYGHFGQREMGYVMGDVADAADAEFIAVTGDIFHYLGVQSVNDHIFISCFEEMYTHPELQIPWHIILGNHEYKGNTQAIIDYSQVSRRWEVPARYYSKSYTHEGVTIDMFYIDTPPIIDKYRDNPDEYPDACKQDRDAQLKWLDNALANSKAKYKIVLGHHPVFAETNKEVCEREDMQRYVDPLLRKHKVDYYFSGHIHNFQAIRKQDSPVGYFTVSSIASTRKVKPIDGTQFCSKDQGFAVISVGKNDIAVYFLNNKAEIIFKEIR